MYIYLFLRNRSICWKSVQFSSIAQSCPTLCDPMNCSRPGLPVHHQLLEFTQTYVHQVSDAIQPSHPLSSPSPAPNPSQHQSLFQWVHHQLPEFTQTHVHWVRDASHPLSSPSPPTFNLSQHQVFSKESVLRIRWPKYWSFSFSISPSSEYSWMISFRIDWLDLLAVQGTLKSLLQHCSSKASVLRHSAFFVVQLSHPYRTTGKTIALTRWTLLAKNVSAF